MKNQLKDRLEVGEVLFFYDRKTIMEKTKVLSVDKKAKTATLENQVVINRYPNKDGSFQALGKNPNQLITLLDEEKENLYNAHIALKRVSKQIPQIQTLLSKVSSDILQADKSDLESIVKLSKTLNKIFNKK